MHLFQSDSYKRKGSASVISCCQSDGGWSVELDETIIYAESGGQPSDVATIDGAPVLRSVKEGGKIEHLLEAPIDVGREVELTIDWAYRFDLMQQHSAQHLITAVADDEFGWPTTSFHLGDDYSAIEFGVDELGERDLEALRRRVNDVIREARPIESRWVTPGEFEQLPVRSRGLPAGHTGDIRLVEIEGVDLNTCGGTHVRSTAELQLIHFPKSETARGGVRLHFLAGSRAVDALEAYASSAARLSQLLSVGPEDFAAQIEKIQDDLKGASRDARRGWEAWADEVAARLAESDEPFVEVAIDPPRMDLLSKIAGGLSDERVFFGTAGVGEGVWLLTGPSDFVEELGPEVADSLEGRGGGRGSRFQGKGLTSRRDEAISLIRTKL